MLRILLIVVAGVFALNLLFVGWLAFLASLQRHRARAMDTNVRELPQVNSLPPLMDRRTSRRIVGAVTLAAMLFAGTAFANPRARELAATVLSSVARGLKIGPTEDVSRAVAVPIGGHSTSAGVRNGTTHSAAPVRGATSPPASSSSSSAHDSGAPGATAFSYPPSGPTSVTAISTSSSTITIGWTDVATETGYSVERSSDGVTGWSAIGTTPGDMPLYGDTGLGQGTTYYYRVIATNDAGGSIPSDVASATTSTDPASPPTVTAIAPSSTSVLLTWADVATETGYRVERSADGSTGWTAVSTAGQDVTTYEDAGLLPGTTYYYRVFATNAWGDSIASDVVVVTTDLGSPSPATDVVPPSP